MCYRNLRSDDGALATPWQLQYTLHVTLLPADNVKRVQTAAILLLLTTRAHVIMGMVFDLMGGACIKQSRLGLLFIKMHDDEGTDSKIKIFGNIFISFIGAGILGLPYAFKEVRIPWLL